MIHVLAHAGVRARNCGGHTQQVQRTASAVLTSLILDTASKAIKEASTRAASGCIAPLLYQSLASVIKQTVTQNKQKPLKQPHTLQQSRARLTHACHSAMVCMPFSNVLHAIQPCFAESIPSL
jgi:hypothetical protein